jgi:hypothetical protein
MPSAVAITSSLIRAAAMSLMLTAVFMGRTTPLDSAILTISLGFGITCVRRPQPT